MESQVAFLRQFTALFAIIYFAVRLAIRHERQR